MPLREHLAELRSRLLKSLLAIGLGMIAGWAAYSRLFAVMRRPFDEVVAAARLDGQQVTLAFTGVADAFVMQFKVAAVAGVLLASPIWLYQLWRFVTPGLHSNERRWAVGFAAVASPLFFAGLWLAYLFLPSGLDVLLGFTPENVANIISVDRYVSFFIRMLLVFAVGFLLPVLVVGLNLAGVLRATRLFSWWRGIVLGIVVFAAVATPTGDPVNLSLLAVPLLVLFALSVAICWLHDRRLARSGVSEPTWDDDQPSQLPQPADPQPDHLREGP